MLFLGVVSVVAFYVAWNLGANDVANSMGTSVGSKAITWRQALIIAGILEFTGAVLFGHRVSETLATDVVDVEKFAFDPQILLIGMFSALLACGIWLQVATFLGLPVASSHAVVGAIAGFAGVALGLDAVNWSSLGVFSVTWLLTPVMSGAIAASFYSLIKISILDHPHPVQQLYEWIPWLGAILVGIFGVIVLPSVTDVLPLASLPFPDHDLPLMMGAIAIVSLTVVNWNALKSASLPAASPAALPFVEGHLARFQVLSACFVAFAHGSNDVGNAVAPLAAIVFIRQTESVPLSGLVVPTWILVVGGVGIVFGLAVWGKKVVLTIGEGIISLQPSAGFCAELAAATTILLASRLGLPASTSHALVGAVVGIGLRQRFQPQEPSEPLQFDTVRQIALAWLVTIPVAAGLSACIFTAVRWIWR